MKSISLFFTFSTHFTIKRAADRSPFLLLSFSSQEILPSRSLGTVPFGRKPATLSSGFGAGLTISITKPPAPPTPMWCVSSNSPACSLVDHAMVQIGGAACPSPPPVAQPAPPLDCSTCATAGRLCVAPVKQSEGFLHPTIATEWPATSARSLSGWRQGRRARRV